MSQSLLLKIARDSIVEVFEANNSIKREELLQEYPVLNEPVASFVSIYINDELRGSKGSIIPQRTLLEDIIYNAKLAAFEDSRFSPLKISEYLKSSIELALLSQPKEISYADVHDLSKKIDPTHEGIILSHGEKQVSYLPQVDLHFNSFEDFLTHLLKKAGLSLVHMNTRPQIYTFQIEKERDEPILCE